MRQAFTYLVVIMLLPWLFSLYQTKNEAKGDKLLTFLFIFPFVAFFIPLNIGGETYSIFRFIIEGNVTLGLIGIFYVIAFTFLFLRNIKLNYHLSLFSYLIGYALTWAGMLKYIPDSAINDSSKFFSLSFLVSFILVPMVFPLFYFPHLKSFKSGMKEIQSEINTAERMSKEAYLDYSIEKKFIIKPSPSFLIAPIILLFGGIGTLILSLTYIHYGTSAIILLCIAFFCIFYAFYLIIFTPTIIINSTTIKIKRILFRSFLFINFNDIKRIHLKWADTPAYGKIPNSMSIELNSGKKYFYLLSMLDNRTKEKLLSYLLSSIKEKVY